VHGYGDCSQTDDCHEAVLVPDDHRGGRKNINEKRKERIEMK